MTRKSIKVCFLLLLVAAELQGASVSSSQVSKIQKPPPPTNIRFKQDYDHQINQEPNCNISTALMNEIKSYEATANMIIDTVINGDFKGRTYNELALLVDTHINRLTGSQELEDAIDYMMDRMRNDGLQNVRGEPVEVPHWTRGEEKAQMLEPAVKKIEILGLGPSVGTPAEGITAEVIVVTSFDDLESKQELIPGKIVVYNQGWLGSYGETTVYRGNGPSRASHYGAVAVLVESVTPISLNTPHTGGTNYDPNEPKIPAACITKEDAELLNRIYTRGEKIVISLKMLDEELPAVTSRNTIGEIVGRELPKEIVAVSGHLDSWDVGQGALDDGGGVLISTQTLAVIKHLGLTPRRTLQAILWTAEEVGLFGVRSFVNDHRADLINYSAVFESDTGTFKPLGLDFAGSPEAGCIIQEILKLVAPINATTYRRFPIVSSDISYMIDEGVPGLSLNSENGAYFNYHHSPADMLGVLNSTEMDLDTALWSVVSYVLADLSVPLPRETSKLPQNSKV